MARPRVVESWGRPWAGVLEPQQPHATPKAAPQKSASVELSEFTTETQRHRENRADAEPRSIMTRFVFSVFCALCGSVVNLSFADPPQAMYLFPAGGTARHERPVPRRWPLPQPVLFAGDDRPRGRSVAGRPPGAIALVRGPASAAAGVAAAGGLSAGDGRVGEDHGRRPPRGPVRPVADGPGGHVAAPVRRRRSCRKWWRTRSTASPSRSPVTAPVTINGRIFPHEDVDVWAVTLKKGQTLTAMVDAERIGSPLQAKLTSTTRPAADRRVVDAGRDPRVRITAATEASTRSTSPTPGPTAGRHSFTG